MDFELDQGLDEEDFNFSAQVERVFESVKNVSAMVNRHVEKIESDKGGRFLETDFFALSTYLALKLCKIVSKVLLRP